jgi:ring-1,2-phenylacetyl-CoA epoxidase subunit PaaC
MMDKNILLDYLLHLADNSLILGQRNAEWCGHGPVLEQDIALTNISLDLFGEARSLFQYAAEVKGGNATEDSLAFLRDALEYRNLLLVEYENTDWAFTIVRQFFFDVFHYNLHKQLSNSKDERLKEIALKTIKETTYHLKWSSEWVIRLGDGTDVSKNKMQIAINNLWDYTGELFVYSTSEKAALEAGIGANLDEIKINWTSKVQEIFEEANLSAPEKSFTQMGGKTGLHSEKLGYILAEMQYLQRAYPNAQW